MRYVDPQRECTEAEFTQSLPPLDLVTRIVVTTAAVSAIGVRPT
jgi:hypothetical protein